MPLLKHRCRACGQTVYPTDITCLRCNTSQGGDTSTPLITEQSLPWPDAAVNKSKRAAALLALFLGSVGIHKFYMGSWGWGLVYLASFWTWIPALLALAEAVRYFTLKETDFQAKAAQLNGPFSFLW